MNYFNIKCDNCGKTLNTPTLFQGFAQYSAESHMMETGHTVNIVLDESGEVVV